MLLAHLDMVADDESLDADVGAIEGEVTSRFVQNESEHFK